jgi:glycosyltransferase involved in cell wall biosynthesis
MKILYHHRVASKDGQYVHIDAIVSALRNLGHEVIMCEPKSINSKKFGESSSFVQRIRSVFPGAVHELAELLYSVADFFRLGHRVLQHKPDFIYERYNLFLPSGIWASRLFGVPLVLEVNAPLYFERCKTHSISLKRMAKWSENYVWRNADHVLPVTAVLADMVRQAGVDQAKIQVIPNGINDELFSKSFQTDDIDERYRLKNKLVLGFTGFVREWHGLDRVLSLLKQDIASEWHLLLVGDGPDRARLESIARKYDVSAQVTITGVMERSKIPGLVNRFDVALQPDVVPYASPLKMFEYMALGKAILAPDMENIREILTDEKDALLFDSQENSFTEELRRLCVDVELRSRLGSAARATVRSKQLYWESNAEKIVGLFEEPAHAVDAQQKHS